MKRILLILFFNISLFATTATDLISARELEKLNLTHTNEQIIEIAKQIKKDTKDLTILIKNIELDNKIFLEEKKKLLEADTNNYHEYCLQNTIVTNTKGISFNLSICIATEKKLNDYAVKDIMLQKIGARSLEELSSPIGRNFLKYEIMEHLNVNTIFITQYTILKL